MQSMAAASPGGQLAAFCALSAEADPHTGSVNLSVPIEVPSGRAGIQPNIQLRYNSSLPNGILGLGWELELGSIQRSTKQGMPHYDNTDTFILKQNGSSGEIIFDSSLGHYRYKQEGVFVRIVRDGDAWIATDNNGIQYYFGQDENSREFDPQIGNRIFKWSLSRVEDLQGNYMTYSYWKRFNHLFPQHIYYTGNSQTGSRPFVHIEFENNFREDIPDIYIAIFRQRRDSRITGINVYVDEILQKRFDLNYGEKSPDTGRSLLRSITQFNSTDQDAVPILPPLRFTYQDHRGDSALTYNVISIDQGPAAGEDFLSGDFNGDGLADMAYFIVSAGRVEVSLSRGTSFAARETWIQNFATHLNLLVGDFNSDGKVDIVEFNPNNGNWRVALSNGSAFVDQGIWVSGFGQGDHPRVGDFNGDGRTDIIRIRTNKLSDPDLYEGYIAVNSGNRFQVWEYSPHPFISLGRADDGRVITTGEFNGDSLTDFVNFYQNSGEWQMNFITVDFGTRFYPQWRISNFGQGKNHVIADVDADAVIDIGYYDNTTGRGSSPNFPVNSIT